MTKKPIIIVLLTTVMLCVFLAGCKGSEEREQYEAQMEAEQNAFIEEVEDTIKKICKKNGAKFDEIMSIDVSNQMVNKDGDFKNEYNVEKLQFKVSDFNDLSDLKKIRILYKIHKKVPGLSEIENYDDVFYGSFGYIRTDSGSYEYDANLQCRDEDGNRYRILITHDSEYSLIEDGDYETSAVLNDDGKLVNEEEELSDSGSDEASEESDSEDSYTDNDTPKDELIVDSDGKQIYKVYCTDGSISFDGSYSGSGNFIVKISDSNQDLEEVVCNEIGDYVIDKTVYVGTGYHYLEVFCTDGSWSMTWYGTGGN